MNLNKLGLNIEGAEKALNKAFGEPIVAPILEEPSIWVVSTHTFEKGDFGRTVGYYWSKEEFETALNKGSLDHLWECSYQYLILEQTFSGIYATQKEVIWHEWIENKWVEIQPPESGTISFGMG